jgi:site-specific recombinase XerD
MSMNVVPLRAEVDFVNEYAQTIAAKNPATVDAYMRAIRQFTTWLQDRPGAGGRFVPDHFTRTAVETYLAHLEAEGYSVSHRARLKAALAGFARWLIEEKEVLRRNPTRGIEVGAQESLAPRLLTPDQRYVLRSLVERDGEPRSEALFALGYWAGCRVSDVAWLTMEDTHVGPKIGWLRVGHKGGKAREIDLINEARRPLYDYIKHGGRDPESPFVFTSQRNDRLTEAGIHHWFRTLKSLATKDEYELIHDVTFHDLRHDYAHRAREASWTIEEIAYYLGHITKRGTPAIQTTARYTQASREQVKEKLRLIKG